MTKMKGQQLGFAARGRAIRTTPVRVNKKKRKHSGRYTPGLTVNPKDMIAEDLPYVLEYDDWNNYRDSYRDCAGDRSKILNKDQFWDEELNKRVLRDNRKHKTHAKRRKAKKRMHELRSQDDLS